MKKKVIKRYRVVRKKQDTTTGQQQLIEIKEETQKDSTEQMNAYVSYYEVFKSLSK